MSKDKDSELETVAKEVAEVVINEILVKYDKKDKGKSK